MSKKSTTKMTTAPTTRTTATATAATNEVKWFHFFERFGTHYVKKVSYGGVMRMSLFLKSSVKEDARIKKLGAGDPE